MNTSVPYARRHFNQFAKYTIVEPLHNFIMIQWYLFLAFASPGNMSYNTCLVSHTLPTQTSHFLSGLIVIPSIGTIVQRLKSFGGVEGCVPQLVSISESQTQSANKRCVIMTQSKIQKETLWFQRIRSGELENRYLLSFSQVV